MTCIVSDQFMRLKRGDSFWYERTAGAQKFTPGKLVGKVGGTLKFFV